MRDLTDRQRRELRKRILDRRDELSGPDRIRKSDLIREKLWQLPEIRDAATLLIYVNFRSEVETLSLIRQTLERGKRVAVPLTVTRGFQLLPYVIVDPDRDLKPGYCDIPEPDPERAELIEPKEIETVVLPGSVFDLHGGRLGYGGGYYDRFLESAAPQARRVGVAFDLQVVDRLPLLAHDQPLHVLVTEKGLHFFSKFENRPVNSGVDGMVRG